MSAIAGLWNFDGRPGAQDSCRRMLTAQEIYGPHHGAVWGEGELAMGRRLFRTLPEDVHDRGPVLGRDGRTALVADVRLDNRDELVAALGLGSGEAAVLADSALLLQCLVRWGESALDRIVGDFAFAWWDSQERRLTLARDYCGQRPLHYHRGNGFFAFASMPKGLHALPEVPYGADEQAVAEFVALLPTGNGRSFFTGVSSVEAGHVLTITPDRVSSRRYWNPSVPRTGGGRPGDWVEGLRHHLDQAVAARLRGAGSLVGSHLSAGYDSAAVMATAARLLAPKRGQVVAFTSVPREGYDGRWPAHRLGDEGPLAAAAAAIYPNVEHVLLRTGGLSPLEPLDDSFHLYQRPVLNPCNMLWMGAINGAARDRGISVLLSGQMGNFGLSYAGHEFLPDLVRRGRFVRLAREGASLVAKGSMSWRYFLTRSFAPFVPAALWRGINRLYGRTLDLGAYTALRMDRADALDLPRLARERGLDPSYRPRAGALETRLWAIRRNDLANYMKGMLGGWGVDNRDPTADRRLIEYSLSLPMEAFVANGRLRRVSRDALSDRLPATLLDEPLKGYQAVDWHEGLTAARGAVAAEVERIAASESAARNLDVDRMRRLVADWPSEAWEKPDVSAKYRLALLRGLSAGHFLRRASGSNR